MTRERSALEREWMEPYTDLLDESAVRDARDLGLSDPPGPSCSRCSRRTDACFCVSCGARLRPAASATDVRSMVAEGHVPTAEELAAFPDAVTREFADRLERLLDKST